MLHSPDSPLEDTLATQIINLELDDDEVALFIHSLRQSYVFGSCFLFATAMHRITGWPLIVLANLSDVVHVGVRSPVGLVWDARGPLTANDFAEAFTAEQNPLLREVTLEELWAGTSLPHSSEVQAAERHASMLLPMLPHLPDSDRSRNVAFMNTVEELSRRHNFWIVADERSAIHTWPVISEVFGEEVGYRAAKVSGVVTMDRMLTSQVERGPSHLTQEHEQFLQELADLSREHGLWIRAGLPTTWPKIIKLDPEHIGAPTIYAIRQTENAAGFLTTLL